MKMSTRLLIIGIACELFLFLFGAALLNGLSAGALRGTATAQETAVSVFLLLGTLMAVIAGVMVYALDHLRRSEL